MFPYQDSSYTSGAPGLSVVVNLESGERIAIRHWPVNQGSDVILFFHGNAEDLGHLDALAVHFNQAGFHFISYDYRGYGLSTGQPSESAQFDDADFFMSHVLDLGFESENMTLWGRSIGGGVATHLAEQNEVGALVLESTFTSAFRTLLPVTLFPFDLFENLKKMNRIHTPTLVFHGQNDQIVDVSHGHQLFQAALNPHKEIIIFDHTGHNDMWLNNRTKILQSFLGFRAKINTRTSE